MSEFKKAWGAWRPGTVLAACLAGFVGGSGALWMERLVSPAPQVATIDLPSIIGEHVTTPGITAMRDDERSVHAARFAQELETAIATVARDYDALLLTSSAVVVGAPDLTAILRARLKAQNDDAPSTR